VSVPPLSVKKRVSAFPENSTLKPPASMSTVCPTGIEIGVVKLTVQLTENVIVPCAATADASCASLGQAVNVWAAGVAPTAGPAAFSPAAVSASESARPATACRRCRRADTATLVP
jgi:hypothetical protein